jgi:hypothetical protein
MRRRLIAIAVAAACAEIGAQWRWLNQRGA